jgi:acetyl esterase/lipase
MNKHLPYINILLLFGVLVVGNIQCHSQQQLIYKQLDSIGLYMELYQPPKLDANQKFPAMVFFFGGGWVGGSTEQFEHGSWS